MEDEMNDATRYADKLASCKDMMQLNMVAQEIKAGIQLKGMPNDLVEWLRDEYRSRKAQFEADKKREGKPSVFRDMP